MLRFFRNTRQKLTEQEKVRKYFFYAVGEILLVVIGILIAFQIDNWNEDRIQRKQELKILTQIQTDLVTTDEEIDGLLTKLEISGNSADSVIQSFKKKKLANGFSYQISVIHRRFFFTAATSGYAQLQGALGTVVRNDELRNKLVQLYESDFQQILKIEEMIANHLDETLNPLSNSLFEIQIGVEFKINTFDDNALDFYDPVEPEALVSNIEYANTIITQQRLFEIQTNQLQQTKEGIEQILPMLQEDIETLKN